MIQELAENPNLRKDKEALALALRENSDVYKKNFKKVVRLMVDDIWKDNNRKVLAEYGDPNSDRALFGSYFYDNYTGPYYYVQEQRRLRNIVKGKVQQSIVAGRSDMYDSRLMAADIGLSRSMNLGKSMNLSNSMMGSWGKPKVNTE